MVRSGSFKSALPQVQSSAVVGMVRSEEADKARGRVQGQSYN